MKFKVNCGFSVIKSLFRHYSHTVRKNGTMMITTMTESWTMRDEQLITASLFSNMAREANDSIKHKPFGKKKKQPTYNN